MTVLVASTSRSYKSTGPVFNESRGTLSWLTWAERWVKDGNVSFFLALQRDRDLRSDGMDGLADLVRSVGGTVWPFEIDEGIAAVDNSSRLLGITTGRNLAHEFAQRDFDVSHILFLDSDVTPPVDCIGRLMEVYERFPDHALVAGHIPTYGLHAENVAGAPAHWDLQAHWASAGCLLVRRDAFKVLRWRWSHEDGLTDDPALAADAKALGFGEVLVRHQVIAEHWPPAIGPFQTRGHSLSLLPSV